jgi:methionyl-tRNA synthetase
MKPIIEFADFEKIDLRVGRIEECLMPEWSSKLLELSVDFGSEMGRKKIYAGVRKHFTPGDLVGRLCVFAINLPEKKMGESASQGMMLIASNGETAALITVGETARPGVEVR